MIPGLTYKQNDVVSQLLSQINGLEKAVLYGSRAKGNYKAGSDIDLTLIGNRLTHQDLLAAMTQFDESSLPYHIDLSIHRTINNKDLLEHIQRVGITIYHTNKEVLSNH